MPCTAWGVSRARRVRSSNKRPFRRHWVNHSNIPLWLLLIACGSYSPLHARSSSFTFP